MSLSSSSDIDQSALSEAADIKTVATVGGVLSMCSSQQRSDRSEKSHSVDKFRILLSAQKLVWMSHVEVLDLLFLHVHGDECDTQRNKEQTHKRVLTGFKNLLIVSNPGVNMVPQQL